MSCTVNRKTVEQFLQQFSEKFYEEEKGAFHPTYFNNYLEYYFSRLRDEISKHFNGELFNEVFCQSLHFSLENSKFYGNTSFFSALKPFYQEDDYCTYSCFFPVKVQFFNNIENKMEFLIFNSWLRLDIYGNALQELKINIISEEHWKDVMMKDFDEKLKDEHFKNCLLSLICSY